LSVPPIDPAQFRQVLSHYPTGVAVITSLDAAGEPLVLVVGSFTSVSLDPPLVGFLPDKRSTTWPQIHATGHFAVNILGSDQTALCRQLAGKGDKMEGVAWHVSPRDLPILDEALVAIECRIAWVHEAGDHHFVLGQVQAMEVRRDGDPMLFHRGRYGGFAALA
jgi:3-hydroxy-9,10-secoandrosta-1,3,5(10)-triene-9,17-dione monooxygenase reductase component